MNGNNAWRELYRVALLELRPDELQRRIVAAEKSIHLRIAEMRREDSSFEEERRQLDDALRGLRVLATAECTSSVPIEMSPSQATS